MIVRSLLLISLCAAALLPAGCSAVHVEKVPLAPPQAVPAGARPAPVAFNEIRYAVPTGTTTLGISFRNPQCPLILRKVQKRLTPGEFPESDYRRIFKDTLNGLGFDVAGDPGRMFDEEADLQRATYAVGARVTDVKIDACEEQGDFLFTKYNLGTVGEAMVQIEWTVYDLLHRKNVYKITTKGYGRLDDPNDEGVTLMLEDAFAAATHNLGADKPFFDLLFTGTTPAKLPGTYDDPDEKPAGKFDSRAVVELPPQPLMTGSAGVKMEQYRHVAVLIQAGNSHGSGFFLTRAGDILTNAHVVGHAAQVRVVASDKQDDMIADVLRTDPLRDVALLRLENIPPDLKIQTLPIRPDRPKVTEDVYAIGAPDLTRLQDTVTKGIVSAIRYNKREKQLYIQSDVFTYPGNSGGPLLDASGNIVGLCVEDFVSGDQKLTGLNLFIPINDALAALGISPAGTVTAAGSPVSLQPDTATAK